MLTLKNANLKFEKLNSVKPEEKKYIVLHHPDAKNYSPEQIHADHIGKGWAGAGYHVYIRKSLEVFILRPIETSGAHCPGHNRDGIGVCFEGDYEQEMMTKEMIQKGVDVLEYLIKKYNIPFNNIGPHSRWIATGCPGKQFPLKEILYRTSLRIEGKDTTSKPVNAKETSAPEYQIKAFEELVEKGIISTPEAWKDRLDETITIGETLALLNKLAKNV